jgi:hypothetical protein
MRFSQDVLFFNPTRTQQEKLHAPIFKEAESQNSEKRQMMTSSQYELIMRHLDALQAKADKAVLISPDDISTVISLVYIFAKPVIEEVPV